MKVNMQRTINTFIFSPAATVMSQTMQENGWINLINADLSALPNTITAVITITDRDGYNVYTSPALTCGGLISIGDRITAAELGAIPLDLNYTMTVTLSGAIGGNGATARVLCYIKK